MNEPKRLGENAKRFRLGIGQEDWAMIEQALGITFQVPEGEQHAKYYSAKERSHFFRQCLYVVSRAVVLEGWKPMPMAVDLRYETEEETVMRIGHSSQPGVDVLKGIWLPPLNRNV
jgi:hypothetical protein